MKKIITVLAIALLSLNVNAQVRIGLKVATTLPTSQKYKSITPNSSYTAGIISYVKIKSGLSVNVGLDYTSYAFSTSYTVTDNAGNNPHKQVDYFNYNYVNIPLGFVYEFKESFIEPFIKVGVTPSFLVGSDNRLTEAAKFNIQAYIGTGIKLNLTDKTAVYAETSYNQMINSQFEKIDLKYNGVAIAISLTRQF